MASATRGASDWLAPLPEYNTNQLIKSYAANRELETPFLRSLKKAPLSDWGGRWGDEKGWFQDIGAPDTEEWSEEYRSQRPFMTASIDLGTGELQWAPLSLIEGNRLMTAMAYTGGMWGQNAQNENLAANTIFAGRKALKDTWLDMSLQEVTLGNGDVTNAEQFIRQWISEYAHINILKGFTGSSEEEGGKKRVFTHVQPMGTQDGYFDTPYELFEVAPHKFSDEEKEKIRLATQELDKDGKVITPGLEVPDEYTPDFMYDYMLRTNPSYMAFLEGIGFNRTSVAEARNQHEWFYTANMKLELNYARQSIVWSDETHGGWKHAAGSIYSFTVDGILNEPDMIGEMVVALAWSAATAGIGGAAVTVSVLKKLRKLVDRALDLRKEFKMLDRMVKWNEASRWFLPSAIPHSIITKAGIKTAWYNPFARYGRNLFMANAAEGALTGGLAEIRNQRNKIHWGMLDPMTGERWTEMDWHMVGLQSVTEAGITPFINPLFNLGLRGLGAGSRGLWTGTMTAGVKISEKVGGDFTVPSGVLDALTVAAQSIQVNSQNISWIKAKLAGSVVAIRLNRLLATLQDATKGKIDKDRLSELLALIVPTVNAEGITIESLEQIEVDLLAMIKENTGVDSEGNPYIDLDKFNVVNAVANLAGIAAVNQGLDQSAVNSRIRSAWLVGQAGVIASKWNKSGRLKNKKKPKGANKWTDLEVLTEIFGDGVKKGADIRTIQEFFTEAVKSEVDSKLGEKGIDPRSATKEEIEQAWEEVMTEKGQIFSKKAFEIAGLREEIMTELTDFLKKTLEELGLDPHTTSLFLDESIENAEVVEERKKMISDLAIAVEEAVNLLNMATAARKGQLDGATRETAVDIIEAVTKAIDDGSVTPELQALFTDLVTALDPDGKLSKEGTEPDAKDLIEFIKDPKNAIDLELFKPLAEYLGIVLDSVKFKITDEQLANEGKATSHIKRLARQFQQLVLNSNAKHLQKTDPASAKNISFVRKTLIEVLNGLGMDLKIFTLHDHNGYNVKTIGEETDNTLPMVKIESLRILDSEDSSNVIQEGSVIITHIEKGKGESKPPAPDVDPPAPTPPTTIDVDALFAELAENSNLIERVGEGDASYYQNKMTSAKYKRVTQALRSEEIEEDAKLLVESGGHIGTQLDLIVRSIFMGEEMEWANWKNDDGTPIIETEEEFNKLVKNIKNLKKKLEADGWSIKADPTIVYDDGAKIAGELDIIMYKDGELRILDIKTKRRNEKTNPLSRTKWFKKQLSRWQKQLSLYSILLYNSHENVEVNDIAILPIIVEYGPGMVGSDFVSIITQTSEASVKRIIHLDLLTEVELADGSVVSRRGVSEGHAEWRKEFKEWLKEQYGVEPTETSDVDPDLDDAPPIPIDDLGTESIYTTMSKLAIEAKNRGNVKLAAAIEAMAARLKYFEENHEDSLPLTAKVTEALTTIKDLKDAYEQLEKSYFKDKRFKKGLEAEEDTGIIARIIEHHLKEKKWYQRLTNKTKPWELNDKEKALVEKFEKKYLKTGKPPKKISENWEARVYHVKDAMAKVEEKMGKAFKEKRKEYDDAIQEIKDGEKKALRALREEVYKTNILVVKQAIGQWGGGLVATAKDLAMAIEAAKSEIAHDNALWEIKWKDKKALPLTIIDTFFPTGSARIRAEIEKEHGVQEEYAESVMKPYFDDLQARREREIQKMGIGHIQMLGTQLQALGKSLLETDATVIDQWSPSKPIPLKMTTAERTQLLIDDASVTVSSATDKITTAVALSQYARKLLYLLNSGKWADSKTLPHSVLKLALPGPIYGFRPELIFEKNVADPRMNVHDTNALVDLKFDVEGVKQTIAMLIARLDESFREDYKYTAESLREALSDPNNHTSKYSMYAAFKIITMLKNAQREVNIDTHKSMMLNNNGNGFKILQDNSTVLRWGDETQFLETIAKVANAFISEQLTDKERAIFFENLGMEETHDISQEELFNAIGLFLSEDPTTYFTHLGNGEQDFADAGTLGVGLVQIVLDNAPGTVRRTVDRTDPTKADDDWATITNPDPAGSRVIRKDSADDFETSKYSSKFLLAPLDGDVQKWAPLEDWGLLRVMEDEIYRNRIKFALHGELTDSVRKQWNKRSLSDIEETHALFNVGRRVPFRLQPYITNKTPRGEVMSRDELKQALYELQIDMGPILEMYIHDAIIGFRRHYQKGNATQSEWFGTGFDVVVPATSLGRLSVLLRLQPGLLSERNVGNVMVEQIFEQALSIEQKYDSFEEAVDGFNENDQSFQGLHAFWYMDLSWDEIVNNLQELIDEMSKAKAGGRSQEELDADPEYRGWKVDLIDRYLESGLEWAASVIISKPTDNLGVFVKLFEKAGINMTRKPGDADSRQQDYLRLKREMTSDPDGKIALLREALFKPGPLRILYGGGRAAFMTAMNSTDAIKALKDLNAQFDTNITMEDLGNLADFLYGSMAAESSNVLREAMNYDKPMKKRVYKNMYLKGGVKGKTDAGDKGGVGGQQTQMALDIARSPKAQQELEMLRSNLTEEERGLVDLVMRASDAQRLVDARIEDIAEYSNRSKEEVEEMFAERLEEVRKLIKERVDNKEAITEADMQRINEIFTGNRVAWKDISALRAQNFQNSVAHYIDPAILEIQARILGLNFDRSDLMGLQEFALYFAYARSHDSKRYYNTRFDTMNIHPVNVSYSKVQTHVEGLKNSEVFKSRVEELVASGVDNSPIFGTLGEADVQALSEIMKDGGGAPLGMYELDVNQAYSIRDKYEVDEDGKIKDKDAWRKEVDQHIEDMLIRDEMLYEAAYGPLAVDEYLHGGKVTSKGGEEFEIFSELDAERMFATISTRWRTASLAADAEYNNIIHQVLEYETYRKMHSAEEAASKYKLLLDQVNKITSIPLEAITQIDDLGYRIAQHRFVSETSVTPTVRGGDMSNPADIIGVRTANPGGYAAMRPLIKQVGWDQVGSLALREKYYQRQINQLERGFKGNLDMDMELNEDLDTIIPEDHRKDVNIYDTKRANLIFPEIDTDERIGLLGPTNASVKNAAYRLKLNLDKWAAEMGIEIDTEAVGKAKYPMLYYMKEMDELFGFVHSDVTPPKNALEYNIMMRLRAVRDALSSELPMTIYRAKFELLSELQKLYRISYGIKTRGAPHLNMHDRGATIGIKNIPDGIVTYEDMIKADMSGSNLLQISLQQGLQGGDFMVVSEDGRNTGDYLDISPTREDTMFMQGIDADMLFTDMADQLQIMPQLTERLANEWHISKEDLAQFKKGSFLAIVSRTPEDGRITLKDFSSLFLDVVEEVHKDSINNFDMFLIDTRVQADGTLVPLDIKTATTRAGVNAVVKRSPLGTITLREATVVGEKRVIALTPETFFEAINTLSNFHEIEMMEYALRNNIHVNTRATKTVSGEEIRHARESLSANLQQNEGFSFREDRANEQMLYEAMSLLMEEEAGQLETVGDDQSIDFQQSKFLDAEFYIKSKYDFELFNGAPIVQVPLYKAAFLSPVKRLLTRLNGYGSYRFNGRLQGLLDTSESELGLNTLMVLGFMLRNPKVTAEELAVVMPWLLQELTNKETKGDDVFAPIRELIAENETIMEDIINELQWREMSPDVALHGFDIGEDARGVIGWQGKANPITMLARAHWETIVDDPGDVDTSTYFTDTFMPWMRDRWENHLQPMYLANEHADAINFITDNLDSLSYMAYLDAMDAVFESEPMAGERMVDQGILIRKDDAWRSTAREQMQINSETVKKLRSKANLLAEYQGNTYVYPHLKRLLNNIDNITITDSNPDGIINDTTADIVRSAIGWLSNVNPEIVIDLRIEVSNLKGLRVGFAQKRAGTIKNIDFGDLFNNDIGSPLYEPDVDVRDFKNMLVLTGMKPKEINNLPEFKEGWDLETDRVVGLDIETNIATLRNRVLTAAAIVQSTGSSLEMEPKSWGLKKGQKSLTKKHAQEILNELERLQNEGVKIATFNGNQFDLLTLGHIAGAETQAGRIALRSFDALQILKYSKYNRADVGKLSFNLASTARGLKVGQKTGTSDEAAMLHQIIIGETPTKPERMTDELYQQFITKYPDAETAQARLDQYVLEDTLLTADVLVELINKGNSSDVTANIRHAVKRQVGVQLTNIRQSWAIGKEAGYLPRSMNDWNGRGISIPRNTHIEGDPHNDPGYVIGLDGRKIREMDTASAVDILFHELSEIAILKYQNEESAAWGNMVAEMRRPESIALLNRLVKQTEGNKSNLATGMKMDYHQSTDTELVAAFSQYYLAARVLGDPKGDIKPILTEMRKKGFWQHLKDFMSRQYKWIANQFRSMSHIFVEYMDESPRDFDDMMNMLDSVFGLDADGIRMPDVGRKGSEQRFMETFNREEPFITHKYQEMPTGEEIMTDQEYLAKVEDLENSSQDIKRLLGKSISTPLTSEEERTYRILLEEKKAIQNDLIRHGYKPGTVKDASGKEITLEQEGSHIWGLKRSEQVVLDDILDTSDEFNAVHSRNRNIQLDGRTILRTDNKKLKAAYAYRITKNMSTFFGGRYNQGLGGSLRRFNQGEGFLGAILGNKVGPWLEGIKGHVLLSSSGAQYTYNSPYTLAVMMANLLVEGSILTSNSLIPSDTGIISAQASFRRATSMAKAIDNTYALEVFAPFKRDPLYKGATHPATATQELQVDILEAIKDKKYDITKYSDEVQKGIETLRLEYTAFTADLQQMNREIGRILIEKPDDVEMIPWIIKRHALASDVETTMTDARTEIHKLLQDRVINEKDYLHPVYVYGSLLLPRRKKMIESLDDIKANTPGWFEFIARRALANYHELRGSTSMSYELFLKETWNLTSDNKSGNIRTAWNKVTVDMLNSYGERNLSWEELNDFEPTPPRPDKDGKPIPGTGLTRTEWETEIFNLKKVYETTVGGSTKYSGGDESTMRALLQEIRELHTEFGESINAFYVEKTQRMNTEYSNIGDYLTDAFMKRIANRPFFVYDDMFVPKLSEAWHLPAIKNFVELDTVRMSEAVARTHGHDSHEILAFSEITKSNLTYGELLRLFADITHETSGIKVTDGEGQYLREDQQRKLHESFNNIMPRKYGILKQTAHRYGDGGGDPSLNAFAPFSNDLIKTIYGTNLAFASSFVEGTMAGLVQTLGYDNIRGLLTPFVTYLKPLNLWRSPTLARDMIYSLRLSKGENLPGLIDMDTGHQYEAGMEEGASVMNRWARSVTHHAQRTNQQLKAQIDLVQRNTIMDHFNNGSWMKMANMIATDEDVAAYDRDPAQWKKNEAARVKAHNARVKKNNLPDSALIEARVKPGFEVEPGVFVSITKLLADEETSWKMWSKLAAASGWGKGRTSKWRLAMILAQNGLMTPEAILTFAEMDAGARSLKTEEAGEHYFHLFRMRQWAQTRQNMKKKTARATHKQRMDTYYNMRNAIQMMVETIITAPNVMDLNVTGSSYAAILHQYRTYPMLFTAQRIIRDSSKYDWKVFALKTITNMTLDMLYTIITMMAGGYRPQQMLDDMEEEGGMLEFLTLLGSRLPMFGLYGAFAAEAVGAFALARKPEAVSPISLAGFFKFFGGGLGAGYDVATGQVDDKTHQNLINVIRVVPFLGETLVRVALHSALRTGKTRGAMGKYGGGKNYTTFGVNPSQLQQNPRIMMEDLMMELFPQAFPSDFEQMNFKDYAAVRQGIGMLPDAPREAQPEQQPPTLRPTSRLPGRERPTDARESSLRPPDVLGGADLGGYLESPL